MSREITIPMIWIYLVLSIPWLLLWCMVTKWLLDRIWNYFDRKLERATRGLTDTEESG